MRALITGVNGFVGGHLSNLLLSRGFEVFGTDMIKNCSIKDIIYYSANISDKEEVFNLIEKCKPDMIFHLAAISAVNLCRDNPELTKKVNIFGTENIFLACIKNNINPKILITSSAHVYGIPSSIPTDESHAINPVNEYGRSKVEQEKVSLKYFKEHNLNIIISRSFNHIGPNQSTGFVCSDFAKQIVEIEKGIKEPEISVGNLSSKRDFTDVRDIVKAYLLLLERGIPGEIYNIGSGNVYSIKEILDKLIKQSNKKIRIIEEKSLFRKSDIPILEANNSKFVKLTGWKPEISLNQSLIDILNYWRNKI